MEDAKETEVIRHRMKKDYGMPGGFLIGVRNLKVEF